MTFAKRIHCRNCLVFILNFVILITGLFFPCRVNAKESGKTVRVGWFESSFNRTDRSGRRSGYAYEYQQKIAAYTGWRYEYVNGSWADLLEMLMNGEIDLLSDVSYAPEREEYMFFSDLPMGTEEYNLFIAPDNQNIISNGPGSVDGKKVGVNKGSIQKTLFLEWEKENHIQTELIELTTDENESLRMLEEGELDAYVTVDSFTDPDRTTPVFKIGSSDYYFAVSKEQPELVDQLNLAMSRIQDENRYFNQQMFEKYMRGSGINRFLTLEEQSWLSEHGPIRVGYQDNCLAFCASDKITGQLTGALKDFLTYVSDNIANGELDFQETGYPTAASAMEALNRGEVDCVFPVNLSGYDSEKQGVILTQPLIHTDVYTIVRLSDQKRFSQKEHVIVALSEGNINYDTFLLDHFPEWRKLYFADTKECLKAVAGGMADCILISSYRYNNISRLCDSYHLMSLTSGVNMDYSFAVNKSNTELYSMLSKAVGLIPDSTLNAALSYYITEDARLKLKDYIEDNISLIMLLVLAVVLIILGFMLRSIRAERMARRLISATESDDLTGLYNRKFFFQYADRIYKENRDQPMDAIVLNIEQFHSVNAVNGRQFGDKILYTLGNEIREIARELGGIAGRFEADRFDIYCRHEDDYRPMFERLQTKLDETAPNSGIRLRMGVMPWQAEMEPEQLFDRARTACSMARGHFEKRLIIYDDEVGRSEGYSQRLSNDLGRALKEHEFEVYYQPKYDIQSEPPRLVSTEALVRWNHPELGMIPPNDFIPLFERTGRISDIDKYVWAEAAKQVAQWKKDYGISLPASVNLSRIDVFDPALETILDGILAANGLDYSELKLEVTESAYTENAEQVIQVVESLRDKGYEIEMDDFGTGYSSLNMLSELPIDVLKMDQAFIRNIEHDEKDVQLVALILGIAKNLKIPVVAEGVETENQLEMLKELGCAIVQGYYFSRPLPSADFEDRFFRTH